MAHAAPWVSSRLRIDGSGVFETGTATMLVSSR
jgi:hypothetical protein